MSNIKFTGTNIAAAILILFYFFPWVDITAVSLSGFNLTSKGISPGIFSYFISGIGRLYMVLAILVPISGAIILNQNITGSMKFAKYFKLAHILPALYFIVGIIGLYFKMKPDVPQATGFGGAFDQMSSRMSDMSPGVFDVIAVGFYVSVLSAIYLLLVNLGKIKDKEYYKPTPAPPPPTENTILPPAEPEAKETL